MSKLFIPIAKGLGELLPESSRDFKIETHQQIDSFSLPDKSELVKQMLLNLSNHQYIESYKCDTVVS